MADTPTTKLFLLKPANGDNDWGPKVSGNMDLLDGYLTLTGAASPVGVITPTYINQTYLDTTNNRAYVARALTNTGWVLLNPDINAYGNIYDNAGYMVCQRYANPATPIACAAGGATYLADRFFVRPGGAACFQSRSTAVRVGGRSRYSIQIDGAAGVTTLQFGQRIPDVKIPTLKSAGMTYSAWVYNATAGAFIPTVTVGTPSSVNGFGAVTTVASLTPAISCPTLAWTQVFISVGPSTVAGWNNIDNGLEVVLQFPSGSVLGGHTVRIAEPQVLEGAFAGPFTPRPFADDWHVCRQYLVITNVYSLVFTPAQNVGTPVEYLQYFFDPPLWRAPTTGDANVGGLSVGPPGVYGGIPLLTNQWFVVQINAGAPGNTYASVSGTIVWNLEL